jgi:hypothetical protein
MRSRNIGERTSKAWSTEPERLQAEGGHIKWPANPERIDMEVNGEEAAFRICFRADGRLMSRHMYCLHEKCAITKAAASMQPRHIRMYSETL